MTTLPPPPDPDIVPGTSQPIPVDPVPGGDPAPEPEAERSPGEVVGPE